MLGNTVEVSERVAFASHWLRRVVAPSLLFCCGSAVVPGACPMTLQQIAPCAAPGDGAVAVAVVSAVAVAVAVVTALAAERMLSGACPRSTAFSESLHGSRRAASEHSSQDNA